MIWRGEDIFKANSTSHREFSNKRRNTMSMKMMVVMAVGVALLGMSTLAQAGDMKAAAEAATGEMKATTEETKGEVKAKVEAAKGNKMSAAMERGKGKAKGALERAKGKVKEMKAKTE
jgi:Sec-independent protein translocase protein TatA